MVNLKQDKAPIFETPVNNAILDPFQGFDADVWVLDQGTGSYNLVGRFTSIQLTVRNATEPYLELNQRMPRLLDGEFQIGWVLERGMLDTRILEQTFGYAAISRELRNNRNVRFQISFSINAPELQETAGGLNGVLDSGNYTPSPGNVVTTATKTGSTNPFQLRRQAVGEYVLTFCKVDSWTMGINAGRNVIANRWEGMCEGIEYVTRSDVKIPDAGTYLTTTTATNALKAGVVGLQADPFPWDTVLYDLNTQTTNERTNNPLERSTGINNSVGVNIV